MSRMFTKMEEKEKWKKKKNGKKKKNIALLTAMLQTCR